MTIEVRLAGSHVTVPVERSVFIALFDNSVVNQYVDYRRAQETSEIKFDDMVELARKAQIPWPLFFAPSDVVNAQLKRKQDTLLAGVTKHAFSVNSRSEVRLADVELIVKDILRKQGILKTYDATLRKNRIVNCLKRPRGTIAEQADHLRELLGFSVDELKALPRKQQALDLLIDRFEAQQVFISQSQRSVMPQHLPNQLRFSGICIRDAKIPFIFLNSGEGKHPEPAGRRIFTLALLVVLTARGRFSPVTYDDTSDEPLQNLEYQLAEELLMPAVDMATVTARELDDLIEAAKLYKVTPSALVMRARRLEMITREEADSHLHTLQDAFANVEPSQGRTPNVLNAVRKYNGSEFSRRMLTQLDLGAFSAKEFCRVVALNRFDHKRIDEFRARL